MKKEVSCLRDKFEELIQNIHFSGHLQQVEGNDEIDNLFNFIHESIPPSLYKYRTCNENNLSAFDNDEIWISKAAQFNDIHDSLLFFDKPAILKSIQEKMGADVFLNLAKLNRQGAFPFNNENLSPDAKNRLTQFLTPFEGTESQSTFDNLLSQFSLFLDDCFCVARNEIRNVMKISCLSESVTSPLMWAHYAESHKGFAIAYDFRNNEISQCSNCPNRSCDNIKSACIYPVIYSDRRYDVTSYGQWYVRQLLNHQQGVQVMDYDDYFLLTKAVLHKSSDWEYEKEWRIICTTPNREIQQKDCYPIKKTPFAIFFGCQIPDIYKKILIRIADEKGIKKYQMRIKDYSHKYELDYIEI